jgi:PadR family transcriptional regulator PadR
MKADAQVLKGHLDTLASLERGPGHGYAVKEALRSGSGARFDLPADTIYPALRRPEAAGLFWGTRAEVGGRRRRSYELTPYGCESAWAPLAWWGCSRRWPQRRAGTATGGPGSPPPARSSWL